MVQVSALHGILKYALDSFVVSPALQVLPSVSVHREKHRDMLSCRPVNKKPANNVTFCNYAIFHGGEVVGEEGGGEEQYCPKTGFPAILNILIT